MPVDQFATSARIAYGKRSLVGELCGIHEIAQLMLVVWCCDGEVGDGAQECEVKGSMVSRAIFSYEATTINAEFYVETTDSYVMYGIVVRTL